MVIVTQLLLLVLAFFGGQVAVKHRLGWLIVAGAVLLSVANVRYGGLIVKVIL